jgi:molybdenum cofactor cytidylyltransferase
LSELSIIILAAGSSTRLGQPKQLLPWQGTTLLQHAVNIAMQVVPQPVVVLGANASQLQQKLPASQVQVVHNNHWQQGIASSIHSGLSAVINRSSPPDAVIFMVCDQPFVTANLLQQLMDEHGRSGKPIVASAYANTLGIPALFSNHLFTQLLDLQGDTGAKKLIQQQAAETASIDFPQGDVDIDTIEEYRKLVK